MSGEIGKHFSTHILLNLVNILHSEIYHIPYDIIYETNLNRYNLWNQSE